MKGARKEDSRVQVKRVYRVQVKRVYRLQVKREYRRGGRTGEAPERGKEGGQVTREYRGG
jgi:ribosomal protein L23